MNQTQRIKGLGRAKKEVFESALDQGPDYECNNNGAETPLDVAIQYKKMEIADLIRKHGGKMGKELQA